VTAPAPAPRHLLTVWNPSYASDGLNDHLRILLDLAKRARAGELTDNDVYVWWAKLRSPNRDGPLPHAQDVLALQHQVDRDVETHLYLTDYRSLWVADLAEITDDDVPGDTPAERDHMPSYYQGHRVDFWFRLTDFRRLVSDDTAGVVQALKQLRNVRYHDRPVSLYGGIVDLPLIVWHEDGALWFRESETLIDGLWAEQDAHLRSETERMGGELRDNLLGESVWSALHPTTRTFLAAAEVMFRSHRDDANFDFAGPAISYAKALEAELNDLVFGRLARHFGRRTERDRLLNVDGRTIDLGGLLPHFTLGVVSRLLAEDGIVRTAVRATFPSQDARWLEGMLPNELVPIIELRNPAAHNVALSLTEAVRVREQVVGIGREGLIAMLARVRLRMH
jgi:hypothetical protein